MLRLGAHHAMRSASFRVVAHTRPAVLTRYNRLQSTSSSSKNESPKPSTAPKEDWSARVLTYEELKPKTEQPTPEAYLIDVREPDEVLQGSIPSSVNLPLSDIAGSLALNPEAFKAKFGFEKPKRDQEVVFYCRSGKRSASACDIAMRNGFSNVFNYSGSWLDWTEREAKKA